jgi:DNA-binding transcriptional ArsR family regulator
MPDPEASDKVDTEHLSEVLSTLGNRQRLDILRQLTTPRSVGDIEAHRQETEDGEVREVPLTRQAILSHIDKLEEVGLVDTRVAEGDGSHTKEYLTRDDHLFMVLEEVRTLGNLAMDSAGGGVPDRTLVQESQPETPEHEDALAQLILIRGIREGRTFPLHSKADPAQWYIGRERQVGDQQVDVPLEYDLFISRKHAVVTHDGDGFTLRDAESLNGTTVNWNRELRGGEEVPVEHGDVIGVGRSLLLFRNP